MKKILGLMCLGLTLNAFAHEGHDTPGVLPPAPHGGVVKEAEHGDHNGKGHPKNEAELFFEAAYKDKEMKVYPLLLNPENTKIFKPVNAKDEVSQVKVAIYFPKTKQTVNVATPEVTSEYIKFPVDPKGTPRFVVKIESVYAGLKHTSELQVEPKK